MKVLMASVGLLVAASAWMFLADDPARLPPGWDWQSSFVGTLTWPDPQGGKFPEQQTLGIYERSITIEENEDRPAAVVLKDDFVIRDPVTEEITWRYTVYPSVDPATGRHLGLGSDEEFIVFPRQVERRSYRLRMNYIKGVPVEFLKEDIIEGLKVFLFTYKGRGEYTESYLGNADYPGVPVAEGQEIKCADDQFTLFIWVEPLTGETVKMSERCDSGDYVFNASTGEALSPVLRWGGMTAGSDILSRVERVRQERLRLLVLQYLPFALVSGALLLAIAGFIRRGSQS